MNTVAKVQINKVKERVLFLSPSVTLGLQNESSLKDYTIDKLLGQGAFGKVYKVCSKKNKQVYALKVILKEEVKKYKLEKQMQNEVKIMYSLDHANVVKLYDHFEDDESIFLIIEFAEEGQLMDRIKKGARLTEATIAGYLRDLLNALDYIHRRSPPIIHRDIKPENLLITARKNRVKLADFGWSNYHDEQTRNTYCGTPEYLAPEMITGKGHDEKLDIWTVGVLLFELLTGRTPFVPKTNKKDRGEFEKLLQHSIINGKILYPSDYPTLAKDLTSKLLKPNPKDRIAIEDIKKHQWFIQLGVKFEETGESKLMDESQVISGEPRGRNNTVEFEMEGKKFDQQEITGQMPLLTDIEASKFFKKEGISKEPPANVQFKLEAKPSLVDVFGQEGRKSLTNKANETLHKYKEQLAAKENRITELEGLLEESTREKNRLKAEFEKFKSNSSPVLNGADDSFSFATGGTIISSLEVKKFKLIEEERNKLQTQVDLMYQQLITKDESIEHLHQQVADTSSNRRLNRWNRSRSKTRSSGRTKLNSSPR
jgi:serine/threonine protein kinase